MSNELNRDGVKSCLRIIRIDPWSYYALGIAQFQIMVFSWFVITPAGLAMVSSISDFGESTPPTSFLWSLHNKRILKTKNKKEARCDVKNVVCSLGLMRGRCFVL